MANKKVQSVIHANGVDIAVVTSIGNEDDYISLTDIAKYRDKDNPRYIIQNWMRSRNTIDFLGLWEELNNPNFNRVEFDAVKSEAGTNAFVMIPSPAATAAAPMPTRTSPLSSPPGYRLSSSCTSSRITSGLRGTKVTGWHWNGT